MDVARLATVGAIGGTAAGAAKLDADDPRLKSAAHEFEASLMQEFLKPLQHDALFAPDDREDNGEGSEGALMSFGSQAMAKAISERGGFGIATKILDHFRTSPASQVRGSAVKL
jgi:Rod binding domain-containing protein